jgi:ubiquinone/menaquinone biosynthesis C-methylase UbiE
MAAIYDRFMRESEQACLVGWREELLAGVNGEVLEIGAGTGANLPHYPEGVTRLVLAEPDGYMRERLRKRVGERKVEICEGEGERLPFADGSFDAVVCTLVLCSVPDVGVVLGEAMRVLRPGGAFVYLEHVAAKDGSRLGWQRRIEPVWKRLAGNCHLTRRTGEALSRAGFVVERETAESMRKAMPFLRPTIRGIARKPGGLRVSPE